MRTPSFTVPRSTFRRVPAALMALALLLVLAACGGATGPQATATVSDGVVVITADDLQFDAGTIRAPAGEPWTITLINNDTAPHNISVYAAQGGDEIVVGEIINQGQSVTVEVPALAAGEYYFLCDIHPEMDGAVVVEG